MGCKISVKADSTTWTVDDDGEAHFNTIQEAINNATSGDTIFVKAGTYYEHVVVNKSISLIGEDRTTTIIDGNYTRNVMNITANNVNINGFTIQKSGDYLFDCGIFVDRSSGISISHNTITNNYYGIFLSYSSSNVFSGNTISSNNRDGIFLSVSSSNVFSGNTISSNNYYGMYVVLSSENNIIYCNNFNNTDQVFCYQGLTNVWDDGDEGNYWSDYTGQDLNADGIGDTAYVIDANNQDNHPLMGIFSDFNVALERKTYHVTTICNSTISEFRFEIGPETGNKIIRFNVTGKDSTVGFCRVTIPTELMNYPYIVLVDVEEIVPTLLDASNETYACLYFTYIHSSHTITIIFSLARKLQIDLYNLNATYYALLNDYEFLLGNYSQLQESYRELNSSHYALLNNYSILLDNYSQLQESYPELNSSHYALLNNYSILLDNYSQLQKSYRELNSSYQEYLLDYSKNVHNIRNLMYIFAATTAIFIITTIYLSKRAHAGKT